MANDILKFRSTPPRRGQFVPRIHRKRKKLTQLDVEPEMEQHYHRKCS